VWFSIASIVHDTGRKTEISVAYLDFIHQLPLLVQRRSFPCFRCSNSHIFSKICMLERIKTPVFTNNPCIGAIEGTSSRKNELAVRYGNLWGGYSSEFAAWIQKLHLRMLWQYIVPTVFPDHDPNLREARREKEGYSWKEKQSNMIN
jgi:hypothetical protein